MLQTHIEQFLTDTWRFVYEKANNNRSPKKTDMLHTGVEGMLLTTVQQCPNLILKTEKASSKVVIKDCYNGTFNIDLAIFDTNNNVHTAIPVKMNMVSINKNKFNNSNTLLGETPRSLPHFEPNRNVLFINFTPTTTLTEINSTFKVEHVHPVDTHLAFTSPIYNQDYIKEHVAIIDIQYQLNLDLASITNKQQLYSALMATDNPISLTPTSLDTFNSYCNNFLIKNL